MPRLEPQPGEVIDRGEHLSFHFDGESYPAHPGDTIASALAASGVEIFSRSFKYHRPRGLLCAAGKCPNCLVNVNGVPTVRACTQAVGPGDRVTSQHRWPSLKWDLLSLIEKFDRYMPVGFYYKTLYKPRLAWRLAEPLIRRLAGLGQLDTAAETNGHGQQEHLHTEMVVVGGGPAGLSAARAAAQAGVQVLLVDDQPQLGGHLRFEGRGLPEPASSEKPAGFEMARQLADQVRGEALIQTLNPAVAFGGYEGNLIGVASGHRMYQVRASQIVLTSGCHQYPDTFENNDLPGIVLGTGLLRLMHLYAVRPERGLSWWPATRVAWSWPWPFSGWASRWRR